MNDYRFLEMRITPSGKRLYTQTELAEKLNLSRNRIQQLEQSPSVIPNSEELRRYCMFFNTTSDYLLGLSDIKVIDENVSMINKTTGLTNDAINTLKSLKDEYFHALDVLNFILSNEKYFIATFFNLSLYFNDFLFHDLKPVHYEPETNSWIPNTLPNELGDEDEQYKTSMILGLADIHGYKPVFFELDELNAYALYKIQKVFEMIKKDYNEGNDANETS